MIGNGTLIVILGFALVFGIASQYWNRESTAGVKNEIQYYSQANVYNIACAAASAGCNALWQNAGNRDPNISGSFSGGTYTVRGYTPINNYGVNGADSLVAIATYRANDGITYTDTIQAILTIRQFSQWEFFSNNENNIWWVTGDIVNGPVFSNGQLNITGSPTFNGQVATAQTINQGNPYNPTFRAGVLTRQPAVQMVSVDHDVSTAMTFTNPNSGKPNCDYEVYFTFNANGTVSYYYTTSYDSSYTDAWHRTHTTTVSSTSTTQTTSVNSISSNVVEIKDGNAHVQGTVSGGLSVISQQGTSGSTNSGNIFIDNNLVYLNDPRTVPTSTDIIGLVADNSVILTGTMQNVNIDAAIYGLNGGFTYQNYDKNGPYGYINLLGSVAGNLREPVGTFTTDRNGNNVIVSGYRKNYNWDPRFGTMGPPHFPTTGNFAIFTWREGPPMVRDSTGHRILF